MTFFCLFSTLYTMLIIRFQRVGRRNDPSYRVVVVEKKSRPQSGGIEILGSYHPKTKETVLKNERVLYWLSQGAKVSPTVHRLLRVKNVIGEGHKEVHQKGNNMIASTAVVPETV